MTSKSRILPKRTLAAELEGALRADIVSGELKPGARLRAEELAVQYGVSQTPIREALRSLAATSLISLDPHSGARVASVSVQDLRDVYRVRLLLEPEALRASIAHGDEKWAGRLDVALQRLSTALKRRAATGEATIERSAAHRAFDDALFGACGSEWLLRLVHMMSNHSERYRALLRSSVHGDRNVATEHEEIAFAAIARDTDRAATALETHLRRSLQLSEEHFAHAADTLRHGATARRTSAAK